MPHKFDAAWASILEDEERKEFLPPVEILKRLGVREGITFADIGCGTGYFTIPAAELVGRGRVFAIDVQAEMLELLKKKIKDRENITIVKSSEDTIPLPSESVDITFMGDVLHELEGEGTLREAYRILRRGGVLGVVDWKKEKMEIGPPFEDRLSIQEAKAKIKGVGFSVTESFEIPPYHYCLIAKKDEP
jgi:ubiquinone/menaquinone biosynthesis C-methylase UbiE